MPKSASEAADAYRRGIEKIGIDAWRQASRATSPQEAAEALESAKEASLSVNTMVEQYQSAYS